MYSYPCTRTHVLVPCRSIAYGITTTGPTSSLLSFVRGLVKELAMDHSVLAVGVSVAMENG